MLDITILCFYAAAGLILIAPRLPAQSVSRPERSGVALLVAASGLAIHAWSLWRRILAAGGFDLSLHNVLSLVAWEVALIACIGALWREYRGIAGILLMLAGVLAALGGLKSTGTEPWASTLPLELHVLTSLMAYSLIAVGAVLAIAAIAQDKRLRAARVGGWTELLPPLAAMERLVFAVANVGFVGLLISVATGLVFVEDLFGQSLIHKTVFSLAAVALFATLIGGRALAGWRGGPALYLYLGGFVSLLLAYFGSKFVLEILLHRQWG